jgi:hypothetical protein
VKLPGITAALGWKVWAAVGLGWALSLGAAIGWGTLQKARADRAQAQHQRDLSEIRAEAEAARSEALTRVAAADRRAAEVEAEAAQRIAAAGRRSRENVKTVERVSRENPAFASTLRPVDLQRLRDDDIAELEAAARRSADLSAESLRGVRAPREGDRP